MLKINSLSFLKYFSLLESGGLSTFERQTVCWSRVLIITRYRFNRSSQLSLHLMFFTDCYCYKEYFIYDVYFAYSIFVVIQLTVKYTHIQVLIYLSQLWVCRLYCLPPSTSLCSPVVISYGSEKCLFIAYGPRLIAMCCF